MAYTGSPGRSERDEGATLFRWLRRRPGCLPAGPSRRRGADRDHGAEAYSKARQREHEAGSDAMVKHWRRVVVAIAKKTGKRVGVDTATRMLGRDDTD
jgi:hypothetical protein